MKPIQHLISAVVLSLVAGSASAQFVKGNEAVTVMADGTKKVETPPLPGMTLGSSLLGGKSLLHPERMADG